MKLTGGIRRKLFILLLATMSLSFIVNSVFGQKGLLDIYRARRTLEATKAEIHKLQADNTELRRQIDRLERDPLSAEEIARGELGLMKADEYLIIVESKIGATQAPKR